MGWDRACASGEKAMSLIWNSRLRSVVFANCSSMKNIERLFGDPSSFKPSSASGFWQPTAMDSSWGDQSIELMSLRVAYRREAAIRRASEQQQRACGAG